MPKRRHRLAALALALLSCTGLATAAPCPTASLTAYVALDPGGCTIGSLNFADFFVDAFPGPTATQIAAASILLSPIANGFALSSGSALSAGANELFGLRFLFHVGASSLTGGTVALGSSFAVGGDGVITALLDAGAAGNAIALAIDGFSDTPASFASMSRNDYSAFVEIGIDGGTAGSARLGQQLASLTFAADTVTPVPEPSVAALTLVGLIGIAALRRRRSRSATVSSAPLSTSAV